MRHVRMSQSKRREGKGSRVSPLLGGGTEPWGCQGQLWGVKAGDGGLWGLC